MFQRASDEHDATPSSKDARCTVAEFAIFSVHRTNQSARLADIPLHLERLVLRKLETWSNRAARFLLDLENVPGNRAGPLGMRDAAFSWTCKVQAISASSYPVRPGLLARSPRRLSGLPTVLSNKSRKRKSMGTHRCDLLLSSGCDSRNQQRHR